MYEHIIREAIQRPWALTPRYLAIIQDILRFRANGGRLTPEAVQARISAAGAQRVPPASQGAIAVIPIYGVIAHRNFEASSGMTSAEAISSMVRRAMADDSIDTIVYDVSSPGGTVDGVPEAFSVMQAASKVKRTIAVANAMAASAAYWLSCAASEIVVTPSGGVGSVGVYMLTEDWSQYLENEGIKINAISAGDNKLEGAWWEPLSDDTRAFLQAQVDSVYADFLAAVSKGRKTSVANVKKTFGQGRVFDAKEAVDRGMADRVATLDDVLGSLTGGSGRKGRSAAASTAAVAEHVGVDLAAGVSRPAATTTAVDDSVDPNDDGTCPDGYEPDEGGRCRLVKKRATVCSTCGGTGLQPEKYMGDPDGQKPCPDCQAQDSQARRAQADRDAIEIALA